MIGTQEQVGMLPRQYIPKHANRLLSKRRKPAKIHHSPLLNSLVAHIKVTKLGKRLHCRMYRHEPVNYIAEHRGIDSHLIHKIIMQVIQVQS